MVRQNHDVAPQIVIPERWLGRALILAFQDQSSGIFEKKVVNRDVAPQNSIPAPWLRSDLARWFFVVESVLRLSRVYIPVMHVSRSIWSGVRFLSMLFFLTCGRWVLTFEHFHFGFHRVRSIAHSILPRSCPFPLPSCCSLLLIFDYVWFLRLVTLTPQSESSKVVLPPFQK